MSDISWIGRPFWIALRAMRAAMTATMSSFSRTPTIKTASTSTAHAINAGPKYAQWANAVHAAGSRLHLHNITTHICDIEGDVAHCESYVLVGLLNNDEKSARLINGRYIDRLERRDGEWKIALRRCTVDLLISGDASILKAPIFVEQGYIKGMRDKRDLCYQRPLKLDETPADRW